MSDFDTRFAGIARLYGQAALAQFRQSHVVVIGLGGVGSWAAEALARSGIGRLTLIDLDDVCISNTNRQLHALSSTIGRDKIAVMAERILDINPECQVNQISDFIAPDNMELLLAGEIDYVLDAIDSVKAKTSLIAWCKRHKIPLITTGGAGGQLDPTLIQIADLTQAFNDPLLAKVRNMLRRDFNFTRNPKRRFGIDCVFSTEQLRYPAADGTTCTQKPANNGAMKLDCQGGFGAATVVTASFGFAAVSRLLIKLIRKGVSE